MIEPLRPVGLALALVLAGCGYDRSLAERNHLGGNSVIASLAPGTMSPPLDAVSTPTTSMSRSGWTPVDFLVPVDGTVHGPLWRVDAVEVDDSPRGKALYPTAESALDLGGRSGGRAALLQPLVAVGNVIAMPVLALLDPPGNHMSPSARSLYKRSLGKARPMAGPVPPPESAGRTP